MHAAPTEPDRHRRAAQHAQRVCHVPARPTRPLHRTAHDRAQHPALDATPPPPCSLADRTDPGKPVLRCARIEPEATPTKPSRHRHRYPYAWTRLTTPSRSTALAVQSRPTKVHPRPRLPGDIKPGHPLLEPSALPFAHSPTPLTTAETGRPIPGLPLLRGLRHCRQPPDSRRRRLLVTASSLPFSLLG
jgi:hypothetical protein